MRSASLLAERSEGDQPLDQGGWEEVLRWSAPRWSALRLVYALSAPSATYGNLDVRPLSMVTVTVTGRAGR